MKVVNIVGADLSKKTIDLAIHRSSHHLKIENSPAGFKQMDHWLKQQGIDLAEVMIVMEHTGLYSYQFEEHLHGNNIAFTKVNALEIKHSMGMVRGKSDKTDARRIAEYGHLKREKLQPTAPANEDLKRLQMLRSTRSHLVRQRAGFECSIKEILQTGMKANDSIIKAQQQVINAMTKQIEKLEKEINVIIKSNAALNNNFNLLTSIKGIGREIALNTLIKTHNFTRFANARKFACYCGTAPFEHTSGSSIRGKTRISHLADKTMKTLLDQGAKTAIQHDKELKEYYQNRTAAGKSKMSTINIIRNKLIYRMFAVIKRQTPFVDNYLQAA